MKTLLIAAVAALTLSAGSAFAQSANRSDLTVFGFHNVAPAPAIAPVAPARNLTVFGFNMPKTSPDFDQGNTAYASRGVAHPAS